MKKKKIKENKHADRQSGTEMKPDKSGQKQSEVNIADQQQKSFVEEVAGEKEETISSEAYNELNEKYLRLYSEFDNYRKRTSRERIDLIKTANQEVISALLPVLDDFERAISANEGVTDCDAVKEGIILIYQKFSGILTKKGLKLIEAIGKDFDTDFHEAITYVETPSEEMKGKIIDQTEKGYLLNDKVIRYAKVVIGQ
jgi:molecular chaperone GrpE